jgi:hypothetical protein
VTETHATPGTAPVFPPGRYGRRREPNPRRRWGVLVAAAVVIVAALAISIKLFQQYGNPEYDGSVRRYFDVADNGISVEFEVRKPADKLGTCIVRARSADGEEVGSADVAAPLGADVVVTYRLKTSARPVVVEVPRCGPHR